MKPGFGLLAVSCLRLAVSCLRLAVGGWNFNAEKQRCGGGGGDGGEGGGEGEGGEKRDLRGQQKQTGNGFAINSHITANLMHK